MQLTALLHLGTQANYCYSGSRTTPERTLFESEFNFSVNGFREDIEDKEGSLSKIANAAHKERLEKPFDLNVLRISSDDYLKRSIPGQAEFILAKGGEFYDGINLFFMGWIDYEWINLSSTFLYSTIHHEIKHLKTDQILSEHPEFKERWLALSRDEYGNNLHTSFIKNYVLPKLWFFEKMATPDFFESAENEKLGFISNRARVWWYEDVAELCGNAESRYYEEDFARWIYEDKNEKIIAKVQLAQEYRLIPAEFSEYIEVQKDHEESEKGTKESIDSFLKRSEEFLEKNPLTVYEITLREERGEIFEKSRNFYKAIAEYKQGLLAEFKDYRNYLEIIENLTDCYKQLGDRYKTSLYEKAQKEYAARFKANDITVIIKGVNDFLLMNGEKL
ncbi:MAG: hypothetical protein KKA62_00225 [Nanoarchaeota archaeon]|nr:hypothetical protein [Nanoarchaeota archaeon]